jgi:hypothetical protein
MEHHDKITNATDFNKVYGGYPVATGTGFSLEVLNKFIKSWCGLNTKTVVSNFENINKGIRNKVYCILKNATLEEYELLTSFDNKTIPGVSPTGRKWYGFEKVAGWDIYYFVQEIENEIKKKKREDDDKIKKENMKQKHIEFCKLKQMLKSKHFTEDEKIEIRKQFDCHF